MSILHQEKKKNPLRKRGFFINKNKMPHPPERKLRVEKKRKYVDEYKIKTKCARCNQSFPSICMDFHHIDDRRNGDSSRLIPRMIQGDYSLKRINEEISKCMCLCANCHRIVHLEERQVV